MSSSSSFSSSSSPYGVSSPSYASSSPRSSSLSSTGPSNTDILKAYQLLANNQDSLEIVSPPERLPNSEGIECFTFLCSLKFELSEDPRVCTRERSSLLLSFLFIGGGSCIYGHNYERKGRSEIQQPPCGTDNTVLLLFILPYS